MQNLGGQTKSIMVFSEVAYNFSKEWEKLKKVNFHAFVARSCLLFPVDVMLNLSIVTYSSASFQERRGFLGSLCRDSMSLSQLYSVAQ